MTERSRTKWAVDLMRTAIWRLEQTPQPRTPGDLTDMELAYLMQQCIDELDSSEEP